MEQDRREVDKWQIETAERLASIERSIKYIEAHLGQLPQSAQSARAFVQHDERLTKLEEFRADVNRQVAYVSGIAATVVTTVVTAVPYVFDWLKRS